MARIAVGDCSLNVEQEGQGTPLVLLHGLGADVRYWEPHLETLKAHHCVVRLDIRGFGASDKPAGPYSPTMFARDLAGVLDACGFESAHIAGHSMGGVIAQRFGLDFPARARSLILVSTSSEVGEKSIAAWQRLADQIEEKGFDARSASAARSFSPSFAAKHPDVVQATGQRNAECDPRGYAAAARAVSDYHWTADLNRLTTPVLILQGLDDQLTPPGGSVKLRRALPNARLLMMAEAGHNLPIEQPELFRHALLGFTAGVDLTTAAFQASAC